jgi:hypothetical protein
MVNSPVLSAGEKSVLTVFRRYLVKPGEMLCFSGPELKRRSLSLRKLTEKNMLTKEKFAGGYSLTNDGFSAMRREPATVEKTA